jgi:large subunit ribosomal protein L10
LSKQREEKAAAVELIKESLQNAQGSVLTDYRGLTVAEMNELRRKLREAGVEFKVVKNTLTWRAAKDLGLNDLEPILEGPTAIAFGLTDPVAPAKIISEFAKSHKALEIKAGILEGTVIPLEKVKALADLPSKEQLLGQVAAVMQAPIVNLVNVLQAPIRNLAYAVDALREKREQEA